MTELRIASDYALPGDAVTKAMGIVARRGAGKTHNASVLVEEAVKAHLPVVVMDPTGAWWGLRSSADGQSAGLPVVILGGEHGDVPLEKTAGTVVANLVVEHPGAYVLDMSGFESKRSELRFVIDFLQRLYRAKATRKEPLLLVVDEADAYAPQRPVERDNRPDEPTDAKSLNALETIVRRGRIRGLGVLLITQRSAVLNKNVLSQIEVLIAMQTTGPQDRAAIDDWVKGNGTAEERQQVMGSLASLRKGEAWVWYPAAEVPLARIQVRPRETFDSSKTPEMGEAAIEPRAFAKVDLQALGAQVAATVEKAQSEDPKHLHAQIHELEGAKRDLERQLAERPEVAPELEIQHVDVEVITAEQLERLERLRDVAMEASHAFHEDLEHVTAQLRRVRLPGGPAPAPIAQRPRPAPARQAVPRPPAALTSPPVTAESDRSVWPAPVPDPGSQPADGLPALSKAERAFLVVLAQFPGGRTKAQIALASGYKLSASVTRNSLSSLRTKGLIEGSDVIQATPSGMLAAGVVQSAPSGPELVAFWMAKLSKAERSFLDQLVAAWPETRTTAELATAAGYEPGASVVRNSISRLRTFQLASGDRDGLIVSGDLVGH